MAFDLLVVLPTELLVIHLGAQLPPHVPPRSPGSPRPHHLLLDVDLLELGVAKSGLNFAAKIIELAFGSIQISLLFVSFRTILRNAFDLDDLKKRNRFYGLRLQQ